MKYCLTLLLSLLLMVGGCANETQPSSISGGSALTLNDISRERLLPLKEHSDPVVASTATDVSRMLDQQRPLIESLTAEIQALVAWKIDVWDDYVGPKAKRLAWKIGIIGGIVYVVCGLLWAWFAIPFAGLSLSKLVFLPFAWLVPLVGRKR